MDADGNTVVTGVFFKSARFGKATLTEAGGGDLFLVKYDPEGNCLWGLNPNGPRAQRVGHNVAMDEAGNPHVVGLIQGTLAFGSTNVVLLDEERHANVFLAKYSAAGEFQWVRQFRKGDFDFSNVVNVEAHGIALASPRTEIVKPESNEALTVEQIAQAISDIAGRKKQAVFNAGEAAIQAPVLALQKYGDHIALFWPKEYAGFVLEASDTLTPFPIWEVVTVKAEQVGDLMAVLIPEDRAVRFYRLRKP